jgi:carbon monoxide dehydrogenase subunit G
VRLELSFEVQAPVAVVWEALTDVQRVAPCLPGAEVTEVGEDGIYHGTFAIKLGPTTATYRGTLRMQERDESARTATMYAEGQDRRGQGGAKATIVSRLRAQGGATRVDVETDFTITGRLARFGRGGIIEDISNRLLREFSSCLQAELARPPAADEPTAEMPAVEPEPPTEIRPDPVLATEAPTGEHDGGHEPPVPVDSPPAPDVPAGEVAAEPTPAAAEPPPPAAEPPSPVEASAEPARTANAPRAEPPAPPGGPSAPPPPPRPMTPRERLDAGALVTDVMRDRARRATPLVILVVVLGFLLGRRRR